MISTKKSDKNTRDNDSMQPVSLHYFPCNSISMENVGTQVAYYHYPYSYHSCDNYLFFIIVFVYNISCISSKGYTIATKTLTFWERF